MGWTSFANKSKQYVIDYLERQYWNPGVKILAKRLVDDCLWMVVSPGPGPGGEVGAPFIALFLLEDCGGGWGYKDLEESSHPFAYSCPLSFLAMAPVAHQVWREGVLAWHARQNPPVDRLYRVTRPTWSIHGKPITAIYLVSRSPLVARMEGVDGQMVKISRKMLLDLEPAETLLAISG